MSTAARRHFIIVGLLTALFSLTTVLVLRDTRLKSTAGASEPVLMLATSPIMPGADITVSGTGFGADSPGILLINNRTVATFHTDASGAFSLLLPFPPGLGAGPNRASARTATASANAPFVVQAPVVPVTPERGAPPLPSATALSGAVADPPNPPPSTRSFPTPRPRDPASLPTAAAAPRPPSSPDPVRPLALGAYIRDAEWDPTAIDRFAGRVGAAPAIVMWYQDWAHPGHRDFSPTALDGVVARGAMPLITWNSWDYDGGDNQPAYALRTIVAGRHDAHIRQWARAAAAWGKPFYLRFNHEMNGDWYPWSPGVNGNTAAEYPAAWRHVVDLFRQEGAHNVRWVWSPNVADANSTPFAPLYPGDAYVDWIGLDGFNWGASQPWSGWLSMSLIFGASYDELTALTGKPLMIAEIASTELGGDKAAWIAQGLLSDLPARFPRIRAVVWFDYQVEADWPVDSSATSLAAFRTVAKSPLYSGRLP